MQFSEYGPFWTIISVVFMGILAFQLWLLSRQLRAMKKSQQLDSILAILQYLDNPRLRLARWFMYRHAEDLNVHFDKPFEWEHRKQIDQSINQLSDGVVKLKDIEASLNALNNIAFLIKAGYAPYDIIPGLLKNTFVRCWRVFHPYITYRRTMRLGLEEEPTMYGDPFEWLVKKMEKA